MTDRRTMGLAIAAMSLGGWLTIWATSGDGSGLGLALMIAAGGIAWGFMRGDR